MSPKKELPRHPVALKSLLEDVDSILTHLNIVVHDGEHLSQVMPDDPAKIPAHFASNRGDRIRHERFMEASSRPLLTPWKIADYLDLPFKRQPGAFGLPKAIIQTVSQLREDIITRLEEEPPQSERSAHAPSTDGSDGDDEQPGDNWRPAREGWEYAKKLGVKISESQFSKLGGVAYRKRSPRKTGPHRAEVELNSVEKWAFLRLKEQMNSS